RHQGCRSPPPAALLPRRRYRQRSSWAQFILRSRARDSPVVKCPSMSEERSIRDIRLEKLARMRELGHDPYAIERFDRTGSAKELLDRYSEFEGKSIAFAGRVV